MAENLKQKTIQGIFWSAAESWGRQVISLIVFSLLARLLDVKTFGLVSLATVLITFLQIFVDPGFTTAIIQRQNVEKSHLDTAFWTNIIASIILTILCFFFAGFFANLFGQNQIKPIIQWLSISFLFNGFSSVQIALAIRNLNFKSLATRSLVAILSGGLVGVTMAFMGFGVWSLVGKQIVEGFIGALTLWKVSSWRPGLNISIEKFKDLFSFGINIFATNIFEYFNRQSDNLLIGYFLGPVLLGYYSIAYQILMILTNLLTSVVNQVSVPIFSKIQHDSEKIKSAFYNATKFSSIIAFPVFAMVAICAFELIDIIFGKRWSNSVQVLQVLTLAGTLHTISFLYTAIIIAKGKPFWRLCLNFLNAITNFLCFIISVQWGIVAVGLAFGIQSLIFSTPIFFMATQKLILIDIKTYIKNLTPAVTSTIMMSFFVLTIKYFLTTSSLTPNILLNSYSLIIVLSAMAFLIYFPMIRFTEPTLTKSLISFFVDRSQNNILLEK